MGEALTWEKLMESFPKAPASGLGSLYGIPIVRAGGEFYAIDPVKMRDLFLPKLLGEEPKFVSLEPAEPQNFDQDRFVWKAKFEFPTILDHRALIQPCLDDYQPPKPTWRQVRQKRRARRREMLFNLRVRRRKWANEGGAQHSPIRPGTIP